LKKLTHDEIAKSRSTLDSIHKVKKLPVYVVLNSIRSSYNVGSIFRTSDGAMIEKLFLCGYTPYPPHPELTAGKKEVLKTSLGSTDSVNWEYVKDPKEVIKSVKEKGAKVCALELTDKSFPYYKLKKDIFPLCLLVGNEIGGVSQDLLDMCDFSIEIPQFGIKQSLNVAVAYGVTIFKLREILNK
jgi:tRNA G18 (ribose-2'-O)-methylase SpoU